MQVQEFTRRVRASERKLFRIAYSVLRNEADCADAMQEALFKAWRRVHSLRDERLFDTWLVRILINECYTLIRRHRRVLDVKPVEQPPENPELHDAIMALEDKLRLPIALYYAEGYPVSEIAGILKIPAGTVKGRLSRGRKALRNILTSEVETR